MTKKTNFIFTSLAMMLIVPILVFAQDSSTLNSTRTIEPTRTTDTTIQNTSTVEDDSVDKTNLETSNTTTTRIQTTSPEESISGVTDSLVDLEEESKRVESEIRQEIKSGIDASILEIRTEEDIEAYLLQKSVDETRTETYEALKNTFRTSAPADSTIVNNLSDQVDRATYEIEADLEAASDVRVDFSKYRENIERRLAEFSAKIDANRQIINERGGELLNLDSDGDGLSDYDEVYIYNTDPNNARTVEGDLTDAEKVSRGIDPASPTREAIDYEDPRESQTVHISKLYRIEKVELVEEGRKVEMKGTGLPNSYLTIYVFSTPVIVTVKTDSRGEWSYTLDKELENGQHEIYVATVNNSGKIIARSNAVPFTKTAEAAALGAFAGVGDTPDEGTGNFVQDNFTLIVLTILLFAILITLVATGRGAKKVKINKETHIEADFQDYINVDQKKKETAAAPASKKPVKKVAKKPAKKVIKKVAKKPAKAAKTPVKKAK